MIDTRFNNNNNCHLSSEQDGRLPAVFVLTTLSGRVNGVINNRCGFNAVTANCLILSRFLFCFLHDDNTVHIYKKNLVVRTFYVFYFVFLGLGDWCPFTGIYASDGPGRSMTVPGSKTARSGRLRQTDSDGDGQPNAVTRLLPVVLLSSFTWIQLRYIVQPLFGPDEYYIDEEFHVPQAQRYCRASFKEVCSFLQYSPNNCVINQLVFLFLCDIRYA